MGPTHIDSVIRNKDSYEPRPQTVPSRTQRQFFNQGSMGQNKRFNYKAANLTGEDFQLKGEHVQMQQKKFIYWSHHRIIVTTRYS